MPPEYTYLTSQESYFRLYGSIQGTCSKICFDDILYFATDNGIIAL